MRPRTEDRTMYEELLIGLRGHAKRQGCDDLCPCYDAKDRGYATCSEELAEKAADAIEELIRRETPMQVRTTTSTKRCPSCNKQLRGIGNIHRNYQFCRWCGQALDWTEPPKEGV